MKYEPISCLHGVLLCWLSVFASDAAFEPSLANLGKALRQWRGRIRLERAA